MALARPPASGDRKHQPDMARIDFLLLGIPTAHFRPRASSPWRNARTDHSLLRQHRRKPNASGAMRRSRPARSPASSAPPAVLGHSGLRRPVGSAGPAFRQKQAQADHHRNLFPRQRQRHQRLAIGGLAERRGVLRRDPDRMRPLLRQRRVVDDKDCAGAPDPLVRLDREFLFQQRFVPDAARNEMMQLVVVAAPIATPSARRSCGRPAQSARQRRADTSVDAPCVRAAPGTAQATDQDPRPSPPRCRPRQIAEPTSVKIFSELLICQSSASPCPPNSAWTPDGSAAARVGIPFRTALPKSGDRAAGHGAVFQCDERSTP